MSIAKTRRKAYKEITKSGKTATQQEMILGALNAVGEPLSGREIMKCTGIEINAISGRINDLKKAGFLIECRKRKCSISKALITPVAISNDLATSFTMIAKFGINKGYN